MKCLVCGAALTETDKFCQECGTPRVTGMEAWETRHPTGHSEDPWVGVTPHGPAGGDAGDR